MLVCLEFFWVLLAAPLNGYSTCQVGYLLRVTFFARFLFCMCPHGFHVEFLSEVFVFVKFEVGCGSLVWLGLN